MLRKDDIHFIKDTIVPHSAPLLSLYADVNPANPDNAGRAWLVRVKNTLRSLSLPPDLPEKVIEALEFERPEARTCALFAGKDLLRMYTLRVDLPVVDLAHGRVDARWGEPYVFPLVYMIDEYERYGEYSSIESDGGSMTCFSAISTSARTLSSNCTLINRANSRSGLRCALSKEQY